MIQGEFDSGVILMEKAELGHEYLIRVRVVEVREETIDITYLGDTEPRVLSGIRSAKLLPLAVRESNTDRAREVVDPASEPVVGGDGRTPIIDAVTGQQIHTPPGAK